MSAPGRGRMQSLLPREHAIYRKFCEIHFLKMRNSGSTILGGKKVKSVVAG
jgi:hypothetical protein